MELSNSQVVGAIFLSIWVANWNELFGGIFIILCAIIGAYWMAIATSSVLINTDFEVFIYKIIVHLDKLVEYTTGSSTIPIIYKMIL